MMFRTIKIVLGVLALLLIIALPRLISPYYLQIFIFSITYSMLALAFTLSLRVGLPRFDVVAWFGVGAYTTALLMQRGMSFWPTLLIGGIIAVALGWLIFAVTIPRGMMVFLMFGIVLVMAFYQVFGSVPLFGGWSGTGVVPHPTIGSFTFVYKPELYYLGLFFLALNLVVYYFLFNSKIGRAWNAIGSSPRLASSVGVDVVKYRLANVLIGNFFLALAGSYFVAYSVYANPSSFTLNFSIYVMMYAIVGGFTHSLAGPVIGATIITFLSTYLRVAKELEPIITSAVVILIIIFMPMGILSWIDRWVKPLFARRKWFTSLNRR